MKHVKIHTQPDDSTCGPTSLQAVYRHFGDNISLDDVINEVERVSNGGTIAAMLGKHALKRNYNASIYVYNLALFDPSWFYPTKMSNKQLIEKLSEQNRIKNTERFTEATNAYIEFLQLGGDLIFRDLNVAVFKNYFKRNIPILAGLSATYLYQSKREHTNHEGRLVHDDLLGESCGHFVVLSGYDEAHRRIIVADPHIENPISNDNYYKVTSGRLINSIMLGVLTYDANLLVIYPKHGKRKK